jgi:hypothetical protein
MASLGGILHVAVVDERWWAWMVGCGTLRGLFQPMVFDRRR